MENCEHENRTNNKSRKGESKNKCNFEQGNTGKGKSEQEQKLKHNNYGKEESEKGQF